jgi:cytochrome P450
MTTVLDFFSAEQRSDPYPLFRQVREEEPVLWSGDGWTLLRYADVMAALLDPRLAAARVDPSGAPEEIRNEFAPFFDSMRNMLLFADPPDHTRLRGLVTQAFSARRIEGMRPAIQSIVDELLDAVAERGTMDVIADVANPLPGIVIAELLGVPKSDQAQFKTWANDFAAAIDGSGDELTSLQLGLRSVNAMSAYLGEVAEQRRRAPQDDLITDLLAAQEEGAHLTHAELVATCLLLLFAGNETTTNLIGNGILTLLRHPDELARLRAAPELIRAAVEELLRFESPVQGTSRVARETFEIDGRCIEAGQHVSVLTGAANRDPAQFEEPDRLHLSRRPNRHLGFGHGIHFCLGAPLARAEGQIAINAILQRCAALELRDDKARWRALAVFRGLEELPVAFAPHAAG